jgi:hypothetical protein
MQPSLPVVLEQFVVIVTRAVCVPLTVTLVEAAVPPVRVDVYTVAVVVPETDWVPVESSELLSEFAVIVPPIGAREAPLPTTIAAVVFVELVTPLNGALVAVIVPVPVAESDDPMPTCKLPCPVLAPAVIALKAKLVVTESAAQTRAPDPLTLL